MIGAQFLKDMQTFVTAIETVFGGGFRQRAQQTYALLQARQTAFVVVAAPEPDALREAAYFVDRLAADKMPLRGLVINRATPLNTAGLTAAAATAAAERLRGDAEVTAGLLDLHASREKVAARQASLRERFASANPAVPTVVVPALAGDVHDLDGLRQVGDLMAQAEA
jgi:anion-transporting  ArsA/GET3 family ATPase